MIQINVVNAEKEFYRLIQFLESGAEDSVIITRDGKAVAVLTPFSTDTSKRIGAAKGKFEDPENFDLINALDL